MFTLNSPGPVLLHCGDIAISWYGALTFAALIVATLVACRMSNSKGLSTDLFLAGAMTSFIGGLIGARLYFVALNFSHFAAYPLEIFTGWSVGRSIQGGVLLGLVFGWLYCRVVKFDFSRGSDIVAVTLPLGQAIGRLGNFFNNEAFGWPVGGDFLLKLYLPPASRPFGFRDQPFYQPTFLYESIWNLVAFVLLYFLWKKLSNSPGLLFPIYLILYSMGRLWIEPLRMDSIMLGTVPAAHVASVAFLLMGCAWCLALITQRKFPIVSGTIENKSIRNDLVMANSGTGE